MILYDTIKLIRKKEQFENKNKNRIKILKLMLSSECRK